MKCTTRAGPAASLLVASPLTCSESPNPSAPTETPEKIKLLDVGIGSKKGVFCWDERDLKQDRRTIGNKSQPCAPTCPLSPSPHVKSRPPAVIAAECEWPHANCSTRSFSSPATGKGFKAQFVLPVPSCPFDPSPHANTLPSTEAAHVCAAPQATAVTTHPSSAVTSRGVAIVSVPPSPSWSSNIK